jgi:replicative DNA helicase
MNQLDLLPPNDYELEKNALSILSIDISKLDVLDEDCFYYSTNKKIFNAIKKIG